MNAHIETGDAQLDRGWGQVAVMLGTVERGRQIGKASMPVLRAAFQRPVSGVVAGDREAVLRSRTCHLAGPCLLPCRRKHRDRYKGSPPLLRRNGKQIVNNGAKRSV